MSEPNDAAQRAWQRETPPPAITADWRQRLEHGRTDRQRQRRKFWVSAAIIVPSWMAIWWYDADLRLLAVFSLMVGAWLMAQMYRGSRQTGRPASDLPCAAFEIDALSRERDFYRSLPQRLFGAILAGQAAIVYTLLTDPRFEKNLLFAGSLSVFIATVVVVLGVAWRRYQKIVRELDREIVILRKGVEV